VSEGGAWSDGVARKLSAVLSARLAAQVIGIGWFFVVARVFTVGEIGVLASGLVAFGLVSTLADLGASWSIARDATGRPEHAWSLYVQGMRLRLVGVFALGVCVSVVASVFVDERVLVAIVLGVVLAAVSGVTDIGTTAMRAVGMVRPESIMLPTERVAFVLLALAVLAADRGPNVLLLAYIVTNLASAVAISTAVRRRLKPLASGERVVLWNRETRRAGLAFAVVNLGPRVNALVLVLLADRFVVGGYTVASRPVEQLVLTLIGLSTSALPLLRNDHIEGRDAGQRVRIVGIAASSLLFPGIVLAIAHSEALLDLVYGDDRFPNAPEVLAVVALVGLTWTLRGLAALLFVARDEATIAARISLGGLALNIAMAVPLVISMGATGAALSLLMAEIVTTAVLVKRSGVLQGLKPPRELQRGLFVAVIGAFAVAVVPFWMAIAVTTVAVGYVGLQVFVTLRSGLTIEQLPA